jgi:ketosteroid isomerase-like protein
MAAMARRTLLLGLGLLALAGAALLARHLSRAAPSDDERILALLQAAARAAGEKRVGDAVAGVSERFSGEGLDRRGVKQLVAWQVMRGEWVSASIAEARVQVSGDSARAVAILVLARSDRGARLADLLPADGAVHRLALLLEREQGEWKVVRASWRRLAAAEALGGTAPAPGDP